MHSPPHPQLAQGFGFCQGEEHAFIMSDPALSCHQEAERSRLPQRYTARPQVAPFLQPASVSFGKIDSVLHYRLRDRGRFKINRTNLLLSPPPEKKQEKS